MAALRAAQNFNMPALSPTMTEGNIATWRVKEGDSFSAGDVLLEIETDKAQMDVEAQEDGIMAKIIQGDGSKQVQVGTRIAVTAEPGDDLSSLEIPAEETAKAAPKEPTPALEKQKEEKSAPAAEPSKAAGGASGASGAKPSKQKYPLYPSVQHLLKQNGLPLEEADKIPATGPNGRLLKGDVLAYIGRVKESHPAELSKRIEKLAHLDLSNIKLASPKVESSKEASAQKEAAAEAAGPIEEPEVEIALPVSLQAVLECQRRVEDSIGAFLPLSTFIARAAELANENLPRSRTAKPTADELFNAVLGLDKVAHKKTSRGHYVPQIIAPAPVVPARRAPAPKSDILDILSGKKAAPRAVKAPAAVPSVNPTGANIFTVSVPKGDERRAHVFLQRVKTMLEVEPGRLVV